MIKNPEHETNRPQRPWDQVFENTMTPGIWEHHDTRILRTPWHQDFAHVTSLSEAIELFLGAFKLVLVNEWSNLALILYFVNTPTQ